MTLIRLALLAGAALSLGCTATTLSSQRAAAAPAIAALQQGSFDHAEKLAFAGLSRDDEDPYSRLVRAIVRYKKGNHQLALDGMSIVGSIEVGAVNQKYLSATPGDAEAELALVEADLAVAAAHKGLSMELCLACWEIDWNGNGRVDDRDRRLLEIEEDARGEPIPEGDPRRRPTFRFDDGDVAWARAFVSFERAALDDRRTVADNGGSRIGDDLQCSRRMIPRIRAFDPPLKWTAIARRLSRPR